MNKRTIDSDPTEAKRHKLPDWQLHLREHGWAVVPRVLEPAQVSDYASRFWDWMESFGSGIKRTDRITWKPANWPPSIRGLLQHYRIGHAKFVWDLRSEAAVLDVFAQLWSTHDLLVSFDGACLATPVHARISRDKDSWAHIDQGPAKAGRYECVQGLMTLSEAGPDLGGLVVYSGSHKLHKAFFEAHPAYAKKIGRSDWAKLEDVHREWYFRNGVTEVQPTAPPGSIILWDSRTVHWAARPSREQQHCRMAVYLCYVPRAKASKAAIEKKRKAFLDRRMTSHWPANPILFPTKPRTYGKTVLIAEDEVDVLKLFPDRPAIEEAEVTPTMRSLAGF